MTKAENRAKKPQLWENSCCVIKKKLSQIKRIRVMMLPLLSPLPLSPFILPKKIHLENRRREATRRKELIFQLGKEERSESYGYFSLPWIFIYFHSDRRSWGPTWGTTGRNLLLEKKRESLVNGEWVKGEKKGKNCGYSIPHTRSLRYLDLYLMDCFL